jgi:hypothetical protein
VLDALDVARMFRDDFGVQFNQHIVCSDTAPAGHDVAFSLRGAALSDVQCALQDTLHSMSASHRSGKQLSLLMYLNMQLSADDGVPVAEAEPSDALVAAALRCCPRVSSPLFRSCTPPTPSPAAQSVTVTSVPGCAPCPPASALLSRRFAVRAALRCCRVRCPARRHCHFCAGDGCG